MPEQAMAEPLTKQCPDCAEQVLQAARKCRFCSYRFDRAQGGRAAFATDLLRSLRKDTRDATLTDVLADWGTALSAGEEVEFFRLTDIDERPGYLLVTNERLVFFERTGRKDHEKLFEYPLAAVTPSYSRGTLRGPRLRLLGRGWEHVVRSSSRADLRRLAGCLADAAAPGRRGAGHGAAEH
jgi:hypothetical protein